MRRLVQFKGGLDSMREYNFEDTVTCCRYNRDGQLLAVGDDSGRVVLFDADQATGQVQWTTEVKANRNSSDWNKKQEIKPSVVGLEWMDKCGSSVKLVSAGLRNIKIWRFLETNSKELTMSKGMVPELRQYTSAEHNTCQMYVPHQLRKQLPMLHSGQIRNIQLSQNQQYMLSTDGKTVLRWNMEKTDSPHLLFTAPLISTFPSEPNPIGMDVEPQNDEDRQAAREQEQYQQEEWRAMSYVTRCGFHGHRDNVLGYSTKNGFLNYLDMRCTNSSKPTLVVGLEQPKDFLKCCLNRMSDFLFLPDGYQLISREYLYAKVWDLRKPTELVNRINIYPPNINHVSELYNSERLEDEYPMTLSPCGTKFLTGNYDCSFHEIDWQTGVNMRYHLTEKNECEVEEINSSSRGVGKFEPDPIIRFMTYHPKGEGLMAAVRDSLFVFKGEGCKAS